MSNNQVRDKILSLIDLDTEFQKWGGRVPSGAKPDAKGWLPVHAVDRPDERPSAALNVGNDPNLRGIYKDHGAIGKSSWSWFDLVASMAGTPFITGNDAWSHYATQTGIYTNR
jgi:hypothetical protein